MSREQLSKEFSAGWLHFCDCIDFDHSALDADAIRFMNEVPRKVVKALKSQADLLEACEAIANLSQHGDIMASLYGSGALVAQCQRAVAKAKKE